MSRPRPTSRLFAGVLLVDRRGRLLLQERDEHPVIDPGELTLWREIEVVHEAYGSDDVMYVYAAAVDLADGDIECREGRQIVFVEPSAARGLDLTASAAISVPGFLDSELYASMAR